jgi:hypothetical protein
VKDGISRLTWVAGVFNDRGLHRVMSEAVYADHEAWEFYQKPVYLSLAFFVLVVVRGGSKGPGAADAVQAWASVARAGAGHDGGAE